MEIIDLHGCMTIFAIACALGAIFVFVVMEETKNRSLEQADAKVAKVYRKSYGQLPSLPINIKPNIEKSPEKY